MQSVGAALLALILAPLFSVQGASTLFYGVTLGKNYGQTSTAAPTPLATQGFEARAFYFASNPANATASVKKGNNATVFPMVSAGDHLALANVYDTLPPLKTAWPPGNFTINIANPADGSKASVMTLANDFYPVPARISNFNEAQAILGTQPFTITWDNLARPASDFVYARVEEGSTLIFETPKIPGAPSALNGASSGVVIPANRLQEGRIYTFSVTVWRAITKDTTTIPGAQGQTAYTATTRLSIRTRFNTQDVRHYGVEKRVNYEQTAATPVLRANPFEFASVVAGSGADAMTAAAFKAPSANFRELNAAGVEYGFSQMFASQPAMDGAFPHGGYEVRMNTKNNGIRLNTLNLVNNTYPAAPPQIVNIDEAQLIRPGRPFTLHWTLGDGAATDLLQFVIMEGTNVIVATPGAIGASGALNGALRTLTIPTGTLQAGKTYTGMLRCARASALDALTYPLAIGMATYARVTRFPMVTASGSVSPEPMFLKPMRVGNQTELTFSSVRGERYILHTSQTLPNWSPGPIIIGAGGAVTVYRLPGDAQPAKFYQIQIEP